MKSRFFTWASSSLAIGFFALNSFAQTPPPKVGFIRFWDMLPVANGTFEVRKVDAPASEPSLLNGSAYQYSSYAEFPVGRYRLAVSKKGAVNSAPLKVFEVDLKADTYFTILVSPKGGVQNAEMIEDTLDPKATLGSLTIRNYFPGAIVSASTKEGKIGDPLAYGQTVTSAGLKPGRVSVRLNVRLPAGEPIESGIEPELKAGNRATLLIIPDSYGKFAPIVTFDGKNL